MKCFLSQIFQLSNINFTTTLSFLLNFPHRSDFLGLIVLSCVLICCVFGFGFVCFLFLICFFFLWTHFCSFLESIAQIKRINWCFLWAEHHSAHPSVMFIFPCKSISVYSCRVCDHYNMQIVFWKKILPNLSFFIFCYRKYAAPVGQ